MQRFFEIWKEAGERLIEDYEATEELRVGCRV